MTSDPIREEAARRLAEGALAPATAAGAAAAGTTEPDHARLVHELQVHQIELQLQNDELRRTRDELAASLVRYTDLFDHAPVGYVTLDASGALRTINLAGAALLGFDREALVGGRIGMRVQMADRAVLAMALDDLFVRRRPVAIDLRVEREGAPALTLRIEGTPPGADALARVILQDVTALRLADHEVRLLSAALDAVGTPVLISDRSGIILWTNPAFAALSGYDRAEVVGRHPRELLRSGTQAPPFYAEMWATITAGRPWQGELVNRRKDGSLYPEAMSITPMRDTSGAITQFIAVKRDLTDDRERQSDALQAQKLESIGRLAGGIAHDFNNLLTVILGVADLALHDTGRTEREQGEFREIHEVAERAARLTRQLLAFSRRQSLRLEILDLNALLRDQHRLLTRLIARNVEMSLELAEDLWPVRADAGQLEQVVMNLTVNAGDAMPNGGRLVLRTSNLELLDLVPGVRGPVPPGEYVSLEVRDSGDGMSPETIARAFEPFFTTKALGEGTGLGLPTVLGIVGQSRGHMLLESTLGAGSRFSILLPRERDAVPFAASSAPAARGGHETILVVDDEPTLRRITERLLLHAGYRVISVGTGADALAAMAAHQGAIDLLLTNVLMPAMSGVEVAREAGRRFPSVRVLYTSGHTGGALSRAGLDGLNMRFLAKPFSIAQLTGAVRGALDDAGGHDAKDPSGR